MTTRQLGIFLRRLSRRPGGLAGGTLSDAQLLERFVTARDEAAFEVLVWRHGPLVLGVCRRVLRHEQDAEDAFQATFLALVRRAAGIRRHEALGAWLYRVAYRVALRLRGGSARRAEQTLPAEEPKVADGERAVFQRDLQLALAEEVERLPHRYRTAFILCCLDGRTHAEAARQLGCPPGTVASRLAWARQRLRSRLIRRGLAPAGALLTQTLHANDAPAAVPAVLLETTVETALRFAADPSAAAAAPAALAEGVLRAMLLTRVKIVAALTMAGTLLAAGAVGLGRQLVAGPEITSPAQREFGDPDVLRLTPEQAERWDVQTRTVRMRPARPRTLHLQGTLTFDPDRLSRLHSRWPGEVVQLGTVGEGNARRPVRYGDRVKKDQLLAIIDSKELVEKKSELVDALVRLRYDEANLKSLETLAEEGRTPALTVRTQRTAVAMDRNAASRAELTLRTWRVPDEEIEAVKEEAQRVFERQGKRDLQKEAAWGKSEVRAPRDGTIVEKNVAVGNIVDTSQDLFKIADTDALLAIVVVTLEDWLTLQALPTDRRRWTLRLSGDESRPPLSGSFQTISAVVDPTRHTTTVSGRVDNPRGQLRVGQAIEATIVLPEAAAREAVVPVSALVEEGGAFFLFVQPNLEQPVYHQRRVTLVRRAGDVAHVLTQLTSAQVQRGLQTIRSGERVVTSGAVDLRAALAEQPSPRPR